MKRLKFVVLKSVCYDNKYAYAYAYVLYLDSTVPTAAQFPIIYGIIYIPLIPEGMISEGQKVINYCYV
jgi:hypothetical protein